MSTTFVAFALAASCLVGMSIAFGIFHWRKSRAPKLEAVAIGLLGGFAGGFQGVVASEMFELTEIFAWLACVLLAVFFSAAFTRHLLKRR